MGRKPKIFTPEQVRAAFRKQTRIQWPTEAQRSTAIDPDVLAECGHHGPKARDCEPLDVQLGRINTPIPTPNRLNRKLSGPIRQSALLAQGPTITNGAPILARQAEVDAAVREGLRRIGLNPSALRNMREKLPFPQWLGAYNPDGIFRSQVLAAWRDQHPADSAGSADIA